MRNLLLWSKTLGQGGRYWVRPCACYDGDVQSSAETSNTTFGEQFEVVVEVTEIRHCNIAFNIMTPLTASSVWGVSTDISISVCQ